MFSSLPNLSVILSISSIYTPLSSPSNRLALMVGRIVSSLVIACIFLLRWKQRGIGIWSSVSNMIWGCSRGVEQPLGLGTSRLPSMYLCLLICNSSVVDFASTFHLDFSSLSAIMSLAIWHAKLVYMWLPMVGRKEGTLRQEMSSLSRVIRDTSSKPGAGLASGLIWCARVLSCYTLFLASIALFLVSLFMKLSFLRSSIKFGLWVLGICVVAICQSSGWAGVFPV